MITIKNVKTLLGAVSNQTIESEQNTVIDAEGKLLMLPALIDPHVHFCVPGEEGDEDWKTGSAAALSGGVTTVFDTPDGKPSCNTQANFLAKKQKIDKQLAEAKIPLRYRLYIGADENNLEEIGKVKNEAVGIKVFIGPSSKSFQMQNKEAFDRLFQIAAQDNLIVAIHYAGDENYALSETFDRNKMIEATHQALNLSIKYSGQVFILHVCTKEQIKLVRQAKDEGCLAYAEATPHHLFLTDEDSKKWGMKVQLNPPLQTKSDQKALWEAIQDGTIDIIGSDHMSRALAEKNPPFGQTFSGLPAVETMLPLLLNAYHEKKITLEKIVQLTRINTERIFNLNSTSDVVLVDLEKTQAVQNQNLKTNCHWSPFEGQQLKGWPVYTVVQGKVYKEGVFIK